jgi:ATP-dependent Clp protease ATP-binding subunit ClpX
MTEPKNALVKQYAKLFAMEDVELTFTAEALDVIVDKAMENNLGARGLRSICEAILTEAMFELPSTQHIKTLEIDRPYVMERLHHGKFGAKLKVA